MSYLSAFRVTVESVEEACVLRVGGELNRHTAGDLREHLRNARGAGNTTLVDLANVTFIDSAGLQVLRGETQAAAEHARAIFVVRPSAVVRRMLELADCDDLSVVPSTADVSLFGGLVGSVGRSA
jgi:anti-sigma B factor antagonist